MSVVPVGDLITIPVTPVTPLNSANQPPEPSMFTAEQVEAIRKQEKDKLYGRLQSQEEQFTALQKQLDAFNQDKVEQDRLAVEAQQKIEDERRAREQEELSSKDLIAVKELEWNQKLSTVQAEMESRLSALQSERDMAAALLEKEQQFQALEAYKQRRLAEESENIIPSLVDLVTGNTEDEIDRSISIIAAKSADMMEAFQQQSQPLQRLRGVPITGNSPVGPLENSPEHQTYSVQDLKDMSMQEFTINRDRLLAATRPSRR